MSKRARARLCAQARDAHALALSERAKIHSNRAPAGRAPSPTASATVMEHHALVVTQQECMGATWSPKDFSETLRPAVDDATYVSMALPSPEWPYHADSDGWLLSHRCQRRSLLLTQRALERLRTDLGDGLAVPTHVWTSLATASAWLYAFMHEHHEIEEEIVFPVLRAKGTLPPQLASDHPTLMAAAKQLVADIGALGDLRDSDRAPAVDALLRALVQHTHDVFEHFL